MWRCSICANQFDTTKGLILHLKVLHSLSADSIYHCNQHNCDRNYTNVKSFRKHLNTHSSDLLNNTLQPTTGKIACADADVVPSYNNLFSSPQLRQLKTDSYIETFTSSLEYLATWLYGHSELNRKTAKDILEQVTEHVTQPIGRILSKQVLPHVIAMPIKPELAEISEICENPFNTMITEHNLLKNLNEKGYYIFPRSFVIDDSINIVHESSTVSLLPKKRTGQILPLAKTFKQFLEKPGMYEILTEYMQELLSDTSSCISNILQSPYWKDKIKNNSESDVITIPLYMYFDDFECGNPLGSHAGSQSIAAAYCQIACFPPQYAAMLENIIVAMLQYSSDKSFNNGIIFRQLLKELNILEHKGVLINGPHGPIKFYFKLALILGDNLGLNTALGFTKSFSSNYYCRICKGHKSSMITDYKQNDQLLRNRENYENDVRLNDPRNTGIREECVFNSLSSFHVVENLSVDIMHDVFEGVCHYDLCHIILYYIDNAQFFDLNTLNNRIQMFNYSPCKNIPGIIKREHLLSKRLRTSASEMMSLIYYLPLAVGDLIPDDDAVWNFLLVLVQIVEIVLDRSVNENLICHLESLIVAHNIDYVKLFKDNLKPKHHFMIHYAHVMRQLGPLRNLWCMRFEAKHKVLKRIANNTSSRKNLPYTLIVKDQLNVASRIRSGQLLKIKCNIGKIDKCNINLTDILKCISPCIYLDKKFKWVEYNSVKYVTNNIIILTSPNGYQFYILKYILQTTSGNFHLLCIKITCFGFNEHLRSYQLNMTDSGQDWTVLDVGEIIIFPCYYHTLSNGDNYCRVRYI